MYRVYASLPDDSELLCHSTSWFTTACLAMWFYMHKYKNCQFTIVETLPDGSVHRY